MIKFIWNGSGSDWLDGLSESWIEFWRQYDDWM